MSAERDYTVDLKLESDYRFTATFPGSPRLEPIDFDEPAPLGGGVAPNAVAVLSAAIGNCLAASLTFCLRKARVDVDALAARVVTHVARNEHGHFRVADIEVVITPTLHEPDAARFERCEDLFENFCIVTESVRRGIPVSVTVAQPVNVKETV